MKPLKSPLSMLNGLSVFVKCTMLISVTTLIVAAVLTVQSQGIINQTIKDGILKNAAAVTKSLGSRNGSAIRFNLIPGVQASLDQVIEESNGSAVYSVALNKDGDVIAASGDVSEAMAADLATIATTSIATGVIETTGDGFYMAHPATTGTSGENIVGAVAIIWSPDQALAEVAKAKFLSFAVAGVAFLIMCSLSALALRSMMSRPLQDVGKLVNEIADGNYDQQTVHLSRGDEIGSIARNVDNLKVQLAAAREEEEARHAAQEEQKRVVERLSDGLQRLSQGDLTRTIDQAFSPEYEALRNNYNQSVRTLVGIIDSVIDTSSRIRGNSEEISQSSSDLSRRTESQAATLEETAAALDELTASVKSAAEGAREVEGIVTGARATAEQGGEVVSAAVDAMSRIESSSEQIAQIIGVIDDIAFQTNLLALNAGVEAARAGEAGRGFAVVASEVRALAQRSSEAAQEIKGLISESSQQVNQGVDLVGRTGEELNKIIESVSNISGHVSSIATGAEEQSISLGEINTGVTQLDQVTQHNAAMVEESTAAAQILRNDASELANQVSVFKTQSNANVVGFGSGGAQPAQRAARSACPAQHVNREGAARPAAPFPFPGWCFAVSRRSAAFRPLSAAPRSARRARQTALPGISPWPPLRRPEPGPGWFPRPDTACRAHPTSR